MSDQSIQMSSGLPTTVLPESDADERQALTVAVSSSDPKAAIATIVEANPRSLDGWAAFGDHCGEVMSRYAAYRVGYHRGLDALRANGWRGSGYVRWAAPDNHGFLRSLLGLHLMADAIGEVDESDRCAQFLLQLDPTGVPADVLESIARP